MNAHHLGQDAAFEPVIKRNTGLCIGLYGNALTEVGSEHYEAHRILEEFYEPYRQRNAIPTVGAYNDALVQSLLAAGLSQEESQHARSMVEEQQRKYGLTPDSYLPTMPGRMNQRKG